MKNAKKSSISILRILLALALLAVPALSTYAAENARQVETAGGRSIVVQSVNGKSGEASVTRSGRAIPLSKGVRLLEGDTIRTDRDSKVYLAVDTSMVLRLEESSEAQIIRAAFDRKLTINLKKGRMFYNVTKQSNGQNFLELMTNNVTIAVRGTSGILSTGNGRVQHQLYDGTVEVYEGETKFIQTPGQMLETWIGPANALNTSTAIRDFTIRDIPSSVAQEMLADENLMQRILSSLSLGDLAGRITELLDGTFFKNIIENNNDIKVFEDTMKRISDETRGVDPATVPTTTETETETSTEETSETEPTSPTETEPTSPTETEPTSPTETEPTSPTETEPSSSEEPSSSDPDPTEPVYEHCDWCEKDVNIYHPEDTGHTVCECGTFVCKGMPGHDLVTCLTYEGGCGETYRECDTEEAAKHEPGTTTCHYCVQDARVRKCVEEASLHAVYGETCEYCGITVDYTCQLRLHHSLVECEKCHQTYPYCKRDKHVCGQ